MISFASLLRAPFCLLECRHCCAATIRVAPQPVIIGHVVIDKMKREVKVNGTAISLTPREYRLLDCLMNSLGRPVTKADILAAVWGDDFDGDPNIVEVYVGYLRRKLDRPGAQSLIATVRGVGYTLGTL